MTTETFTAAPLVRSGPTLRAQRPVGVVSFYNPERRSQVSIVPGLVGVILTMTIERLSITWEERGGGHAFKVAVGRV